MDAVRPWDTQVSVADAPEPEIEYEAAVGHVVDTVAPLGEAYQERARRFFAQRRVDVYECADKRSDIPAFCPSSAEDGAFVLLNFQRDVRATFHLCHELGHALHVEHHREGPAMYATGPCPISEVPSVLHEVLLTEHLAQQNGPLAAHARERLLQSLEMLLYEQAANAAFKRRLAATVDGGERLTADRIADAYRETLARFDPALEPCDRTRFEWLTGALFRDAFHHYQYVLGAVGALRVRESLRDGRLDPATYREFLRSTGRDDPVSLFERLGVDLTTSAPYERAARAFEGYLDRWT
ncbi:M3 family metallopeptidase [Halomicrobium katesii]|uniref:M3 family metallopeptidase n=1 Tax=Halomicrobium katesii TaxID=437163 RepID=UPI001FE159FA|nr:M3 family metallopeptidase [Halomicrobium katesii]